MKEVIDINNVSKYFGKFKALDSVNLRVMRGRKLLYVVLQDPESQL